MTEYRSAPECPRCASPLRAHDQHLVCDTCHGALLPLADFAGSLDELDGARLAIVVQDPTPSRAACPRCGGPTHEVNLVRGSHRLAGRFIHCEQHGAWIPRESMVAGYARAAHGGGSPGARSGRGNAFMDISPAAAGMRAVRDAFAVSTPMIGQYELPRPLVHTLFISAFRGHPLGCPVCAGTSLAFEGYRWNCASCAGTFAEDAALVELISDIQHAAWAVPPATGTPGERPCPVCKDAMLVEKFEGVTVDRCVAHGIWFDAKELEAALLHAGEPPGLLARLFHRRR